MQALAHQGWEHSVLKSVRSFGRCVTPKSHPQQRGSEGCFFHRSWPPGAGWAVGGDPWHTLPGLLGWLPATQAYPLNSLSPRDLLTHGSPAFSPGGLSNVMTQALLPFLDSCLLWHLCKTHEELESWSIRVTEGPKDSLACLVSILPRALTLPD